MRYIYTVIHPNNEQFVTITDEEADLTWLQEAVGGWIELIRTSRFDGDIWVNEEGLIKRLEYNHMASLLVGQHLVGPVIFAEVEL
tara:strand:- start:905 stop:1159 length:255 start_codon:yes stop_codon:yes gene_type:complete